MSGGRRTKEITTCGPTKEDAMARLMAAFINYTMKSRIAVFTWKVPPQALHDEITKEWRAYGRIKWK